MPKSLLSIDGAFYSAITELPDICRKNNTRFYPKGHKSDFFTEKMPSGNSEVLFFMRRTLAEIPKLGFILPQRTYNFASNFSSMCKNCTLTVSSIIWLSLFFFKKRLKIFSPWPQGKFLIGKWLRLHSVKYDPLSVHFLTCRYCRNLTMEYESIQLI